MGLRRANAPGTQPGPASRALALLHGRVRWAVTAVVLAALPALFVVALGDGDNHTKITAEYVRTGSWGGGFSAQYVLRNTGEETSHGWTLRFRLAPGSEVATLWNGRMDHADGRYTVRDREWNHDLRPGETAVVAFQVRHDAVTETPPEEPVECSINGSPCLGIGALGVSADGNGDGTRSVPRDGVPATPRDPAPRAATTTPPAATPTRPTGPAAVPSTGASGSTAPGTGTQAPTGTPPISTPVRPYVDLAASGPFDLTAAFRAAGVTGATLAFVVDAGGCRPAWGGGARLDDPVVVQRFAELKALGAVASVSFGGTAGTDLAATCATPEALAAAYREVVNQYGVERIDLDVEGRSLGRPDIVERRNEALKLLRQGIERDGGRLELTYSLPALPLGFGAESMALLRDAAARGLTVDVVNVLAMDYGQANAKEPAGQMGRYATDAAVAVQGQLRGVWPTLTGDQVWKLMSVTAMIGVDDVPGEVFTVDDARVLARFAAEHHLGYLSWWSVSRDRACPGNAVTAADPVCSGLPQDTYAFLHAFVGG